MCQRKYININLIPKAKDDQITDRVGPANRAGERGLGQDGAGVSPYLLYRMLKEYTVLITYNDSQGGKLPTTHREFKGYNEEYGVH